MFPNQSSTGLLANRTFALPNLIVIGSQKCGTTSLHYYLSLHPEIFMSRQKELNFFAVEGNWHKGVEWYRSHFDGQARIYGESSPNYTQYPLWPGVPERMYSVIPEARLIFLVRDPFERLLAHYVHRVAAGTEDRSLGEALAILEPNRYICRSQYYLQLSQFLEFYSLSNILILQQSELKYKRSQTLQRVFRFLEVNDEFASSFFWLEAHHTRDKRRLTPLGRRISDLPGLRAIFQIPFIGWQLHRILLMPLSKPVARPVIQDGLRDRVVEFLKPDIDRFRNLTGQSFSEWGV